MHIVMLAAENDLLPGGKVGGIGDVIRDVPAAMAEAGHRVSVVLPSYGSFHQLPGAALQATLNVNFAGHSESVDAYRLTDADKTLTSDEAQVDIWILDHGLFSIGGAGNIYCNDPSDSPFASDASKFALFSRAAMALLQSDAMETADAIHLHDWHTAFFAIVREFDPACENIKRVRCVYSIHNLALQGIRPLYGDASSLHGWYPDLYIDPARVSDPRWPNCINPMAAAIRLCDAVHTVSPSYSHEILQSSRVEKDGFYGGEGLEEDLHNADQNGRLFGILNGCKYLDTQQTALQWQALYPALRKALGKWLSTSTELRSSDYIADQRLQSWRGLAEPQHIITSIGRLTEQKARLFTHIDEQGLTTLDQLLESLGDRGVFILLGSGDPAYEQFFRSAASQHENFVFLNFYDGSLSDQLYASGNLFLMPSSFEPCGISQMLAMRAAQPCLVHAVGGLADTVTDQLDGFSFTGESFTAQAEAFTDRFSEILEQREQHPVRWREICNNAAAARFLWKDSVDAYVDKLYQIP